MKIVFMGTTDFSVPILEGLRQFHEVALVVTQPDRPFGRKQQLKPSPVKTYALEHGLKVFQPEHIRTDHQLVLDENPDCIIVAAFGQMIPKIILNQPKYKCINVHASLLPKYRGGSPMHTAIKNGDAETGVTIMYMAMKMDAGAILSQASIPILDSDNVGSIENKLSRIGTSLLLDTLVKVEEGTIIAQNQDESGVTFAWNIKPEEEHIDFDRTAREVFNHVRAFYPWPITYFTIDGQTFKLHEVGIVSIPEGPYIDARPGEIVSMAKGEVLIKVKDGIVALKTIQPAGRTPMDVKAFMNGAGKSVFNVGKLLK